MCQRAIIRTAQLWCFTQAAGPPTLPQPLLYLRTLQFYQYFIFQIFLDDNGHWITVKTIEVANDGNEENINPNVESERSKLPIRKQRKAPKREAPSDAFSREAEATLDFIEDRKRMKLSKMTWPLHHWKQQSDTTNQQFELMSSKLPGIVPNFRGKALRCLWVKKTKICLLINQNMAMPQLYLLKI